MTYTDAAGIHPQSTADAEHIDDREFYQKPMFWFVVLLAVAALVTSYLTYQYYRWPAAFTIAQGEVVLDHVDIQDPAKAEARSVDLAERVGAPLRITPLGGVPFETADYDLVRRDYLPHTDRYRIDMPVWPGDVVDARSRTLRRADGTVLRGR